MFESELCGEFPETCGAGDFSWFKLIVVFLAIYGLVQITEKISEWNYKRGLKRQTSHESEK